MRDDNDVYVDDVFNKLKQLVKRIFRLIFKVFSLIWSKKIIFLALIVLGLIIGFFLDHNRATRYETVLQIRTFQASTEYIYNVVDNLNKNLGDTTYLKENGFKNQELQSVDIVPMANMEDLLSTFRDDDSKTLETLILNTSTQDLLTSEFFRSQYSQHEVAIRFGSDFDQNSIANFLNFLNGNPYYQDFFKLSQSTLQTSIMESESSIAKIDTLIANYNGNLKQGSAGEPMIAFISEQRATSIFNLLQFRTDLVEDIATIRLELNALTAPVTLTNKPIIIEQVGLAKNKIVFVPIVLISAFLLILLLIAFYRKMKHWVQKP
jgi:hypothetical protein